MRSITVRVRLRYGKGSEIVELVEYGGNLHACNLFNGDRDKSMYDSCCMHCSLVIPCNTKKNGLNLCYDNDIRYYALRRATYFTKVRSNSVRVRHMSLFTILIIMYKFMNTDES